MKKTKKPEGRPPLFKTTEELQSKITEYFKKGVKRKRVWQGDKAITIPIPTITGLILYCGFCDRSSFYNLESNPEFSHTIKKARTFIESTYEEYLHTGNCTGAIFALKNFGWKDKQEVEHLLSDSTIEKFASLSVNDLLTKANALIGKSKG
jgi:hypothetical protein